MKKKDSPETPEVARLTRYYEHDGMLRAYANRAMFLAILFGTIAFASLGFAIYVRIQPPTVIRVDIDGHPTVVGDSMRTNLMLTAQDASPDATDSASTRPPDIEGK